MTLTELLALLGTLGGFEAFKWILASVANRKTNVRKEKASALSMEREEERNHVKYLEDRLLQRDSKIDALYVELRQAQGEHMKSIYSKHAIELELAHCRCDVEECVNRKPPRLVSLKKECEK